LLTIFWATLHISLHMLKDIRRLDAVQRRFTKKLDLNSLTYTERLTLLGLERLEARRIRADLLFVYKLLFGFTVLRADHYFCLSERFVTRGHPFKLFLPRCYTNVRKHYFCNYIVKIWNDWPSDTDFTSIGTFSTLARFNLLVYCDQV